MLGNKVGSAEIELRATTDKLRADIEKAKTDIKKSSDSMEKSFEDAKGGLDGMNKSAMRFAQVGAAGMATGLAAIAKSSIETAKRFESLNNRLSRLTSSGQDFAETQDYIREASNRLNVDIEQYSDTVSRLLALEKSGVIQNRERVKQLSEGIIEAAAAYGASGSQIENVLYGMSQALGQGVVQMQELNQVVEPMPGFLGDLAAAAGMSAGEFRKLVGEGKVTSEMFSDILVKAFKRSEGAASGMTDTITGATARLQNEWKMLQLTIAEGFVTDSYEAFLNLLTRTLSVMQDVIAGARAIAAEIQKISGIDLGANAIKVQQQKVERLRSYGAGDIRRRDIFGGDTLQTEQAKLYDLQAQEMRKIEAQYRQKMGFDVKTGAPVVQKETITGGGSQTFTGGFREIKEGAKSATTAIKELEKSVKETDQSVKTDLTSAFDNLFDGIIDGSGDAKDAVRGLILELGKIAISKAFGGSEGGGSIGGLISGAIGGLFDKLPSFDTGTPYVASDMVAQIHKGEAVLTPHQADMWRSGSGGAVYNIDARNATPGVEQRIKNVMMEVQNLRASVPSISVGAVRESKNRGVDSDA